MSIRFHWVYLAAVFVLVACFPKEEAKDPKDGKPAGPELVAEKNEHAGAVPLVIVNKTKYPIGWFELQPADASGYDNLAYVIGAYDHYGQPKTKSANPTIPPGGRGQFPLKAAKYRLSLYAGPENKSGEALLIGHKVDLSGPTELVIYEGPTPPTDPPAAGMKQLVTMTWHQQSREKEARDKAAGEASAKANAEVCMKNVPSKSEKAAPGKIKVDGKWSCILGGAYTGTDVVNLRQLAGGNIQATLTGVDRNTTWEGVVVGDEVHFRFTGVDLSGGKIKVDPGGKAMSGKAWTYAESTCNEWTLTCNKN